MISSHYTSTNPIDFNIAPCPLGLLLVAQTQQGLCAIFLGDDEIQLTTELHKQFPHSKRNTENRDLNSAIAQLIDHIDQPNRRLNLTLDIIQGTPFQRKVWKVLSTIPFGETMTYSEVAHRINSPKAVRAAAHACGMNPLSIIIPCHRVIGKNGSLSGYRWGIERKQALLQKEKQYAIL